MAKKKSSSGAVAKAWTVFNKHPKAERHEVLAACAKAGINSNTAKTQYQLWAHASKTERAAKGGRFTWQAGDLKPVADKKAAPAPTSTAAQS